MKHTLLVASIAALSAFASCNNATPPADNGAAKKDSTAMKTETKEERNKKVVMSSMEGINSHDINKVFAGGDISNFTEYSDGAMPPVKGDSAKQMLAGFLNAFPDLKEENSMYFADGNTVVVVSDYTMTFKNEVMGIKPTGKTIKLKDVDIFTLDDNGKITSHRNIYPTGAVFMQLGADMSKMPGMADKDMKKDAGKK